MNEVNLFQCEAQGIPVLGLAWYVSGPELEAKSGVDFGPLQLKDLWV